MYASLYSLGPEPHCTMAWMSVSKSCLVVHKCCATVRALVTWGGAIAEAAAAQEMSAASIDGKSKFAVQTNLTISQRPVEVRSGLLAELAAEELDASVLQHASGASLDHTLCKQAVRERIIIAKALKVTAAAACSGAAPLLEFRHDCQGAAPSSNHAFIAYARPMTIS